MADLHPAWERIEAEARELARHHEMIPGEHAIELSKAISLKRIADAIEAWAQGAFNYPQKPNPFCEHGLPPLDCGECVPLP